MPKISNPDESPRGVRLAGRLPKQAAMNGVAELAGELIDEPKRQRVAVIVFDVSRRIEDEDEDTVTSVIRILRIEPLTGRAESTARKLLMAAASARTGEDELPLAELDDDELAER